MLDIEIEALQITRAKLGEQFLNAVQILDKCQGKVVVTGLGKSGIAGKKIAATLTATGEPSLFLHSAEAVHGDLGVVSSGDVLIALSYSGETRELLEIIPRVKLLGVPIIALTGNVHSSLAKFSDCVLDVSVPNYNWPFGLIPTASNTAAVAVGDALAVVLIHIRNIKEHDFARLHPGGLLGRKLLVEVGHLMHIDEELPLVRLNDSVKTVLTVMTTKRLGVACIVDQDQRLLGIFTDGDLRRVLERHSDPLNLKASEVMTESPKYTSSDTLAAAALQMMETHSITTLPVLTPERKLIGIIHLHDIIKQETHK